MKLSDAAVLGASRWERVCYPVLSDERIQQAGCFLQVALMAVGCTSREVLAETCNGKLTIKAREFWPWISQGPDSAPYGRTIWKMNDRGTPFEDILAYVRAHEPGEPSEEALPQQESEPATLLVAGKGEGE